MQHVSGEILFMSVRCMLVNPNAAAEMNMFQGINYSVTYLGRMVFVAAGCFQSKVTPFKQKGYSLSYRYQGGCL